jgi:hypothetical protein
MLPIKSKSVWGLATSKLQKKKKKTSPKASEENGLHFTLSNIFMSMTLFNISCLLV